MYDNEMGYGLKDKLYLPPEIFSDLDIYITLLKNFDKAN